MYHHWATTDRLEKAQSHFRSCYLCEHRCGADRRVKHLGPCKAGTTPNVFRCRVEYGDESEIAPSLLVYLSGCDLRCVYCINELNAFDPARGQPLTAELLQAAIAAARREGARTLQWVGGEPTIHLPAILHVMAACPQLLPVVWKTDLFGTESAMHLLDGVVDTYLADFKFGNNDCALRLAKVENYMSIVRRNLRLVARQGNLIVRHLQLPGHLECCVRPLVEWLQAEMPAVKFSLRHGYLPHWQAAHYLELGRPLALAETAAAQKLVQQSGLNLVP